HSLLHQQLLAPTSTIPRQLGLPYWHSSNRTEKTAFLLRCFCRRKVAFAVLVADEVNFEPIAGSPAGYRRYREPCGLEARSGATAVLAAADGSLEPIARRPPAKRTIESRP